MHQSSVPSNMTPLYFFRSNIDFGQRSQLKSKWFRLLGIQVKICQIPHVNFQMTSQFLFNFASSFIVTRHNSSVNFKLINFLLWTKGSHQNPNFHFFKCSGGNLPNFSCHFSNHKSVFLRILYHYLVSWKMTPLYCFSSNIVYFGPKEPINTQMF